MISFDYQKLFEAAHSRGYFAQTCRSRYAAARLRHNLYSWRKRQVALAKDNKLAPEHTRKLFQVRIHLSDKTVILEDTSHGTDCSRISTHDYCLTA